MNDEPPTPFDTVGDEPVEARIVAWVLGEASAFEAAELERLCEERPELLVFRRRMRALHGLLTEAEASQPDESWKLPPEKRKALDEIFGDEPLVPVSQSQEKRIRHSGRRAILAIAACLVITFFIARLEPWKHEAEAVIEVKPRSQAGSVIFGREQRAVVEQKPLSPQFFGTEFEKIKSSDSLAKVVDDLHLEKRWGMDKEAAVQKLKNSIATENIPGTDLLSIRVRHANREDADDIVHEVVDNYKDYRRTIDNRDADKGLLELKRAVQDQEDKVEEKRKILADIVRKKFIIYKGSNSFYGASDVDEDQGARSSLDAYYQVQREKTQLESQINSLSKYDGDQLAVYASGLDLPDNTIKVLYPDYLAKKRDLDAKLAQGLGKNQPEVQAEEKQVTALKSQIDEGVVNLRETLKAKIDMAANSLKSIEVMKDDTREDAIKRGLDSQDYVEAKHAFETDQQLLQSLKLAQMGKMIEQKMTEDSVVVHEEPPRKSKGIDITGGSGFQLDAPAKPAAMPAQKSDLAYNVESAPRSAGRKLGALEAAKQSQLAHRPARGDSALEPALTAPRGEVEASEAIADLPALADSRSGLAKEAGSRGFAVPQSQPAPAAAADSFAEMKEGTMALAKSKTERENVTRQPRPRVSGPLGMRPGVAAESTADDNVEPGMVGAETPPPALAAKDFPVTPATPLGFAGNDIQESRIAAASDAAKIEITREYLYRTGRDKSPADEPISAGNAAALAGKDSRAEPAGSLADREIARRRNSVSESDTLLNEGRQAYAKGDYQEASDKYGLALEKLPDAAALGDRRKSVTEHLADADVALAMQNRKAGKYAEARQLLEGVAKIDPDNTDAKRELGYLEDPMRTNPALTDEHSQNVDKVRRGLYTAEGNFNLGKYDDSKNAYEEVLRTDPHNTAALRGLERVAVAKTDYYRAAYDQNRAELLGRVDNAWELAVPADGEKKSAPAELAKQIAELGRQLDEPALNDSKKQVLFKQLHESQKMLEELTRSIQDETPKTQVAASPDLPELMEEIPASEDPYSTFSLNVSDASFQLAKAALAKGERPDPADVKPEQFYNAVDYGDPAPVAGQPVAATIEQCAHPVIPGRNLVRVALRVGSTGRSAAQPLRLTLLVDQSGSMAREDRRAAMDHALKQLGVLLTKDDLVTVIGFSRTPHLLADGLPGDQAGKLTDLANQTASEGGTNLEEAMKLGAEKAAAHRLDGAQNRIVLFTDGAANLGDANPDRLAAQVKSLRQQGIAFDVAGIGADGLNDRLLSELARNGNGRYYVVGDEKNDSFARQLAGAFRPAAENVKVQVIFNPQRVGRYKLIGFEKDRLKTEDFRNDAVDAAELAADEAAVAVYQVEPLPGGSGELGEVSVRFRDTAGSGEMVERSWTMSYDEQASAFDRATPSMQLAGLSMLAAEKLKGGPLGAAIDFNQLSGSAASVKQFYGNSPRVGEMLRVIDQLK